MWYHLINADTFLELVDLDDGKFNPVYWKKSLVRPIRPREMFGRLLQDYNLIGMSREEVLRLLGPGVKSDDPDPDAFSYMLESRGHPSFCIYAVLHMKNDTIASWTFLHAKPAVEPITTNVVLDVPEDSDGQLDSEITKTRSR